MVNYLDRTVLGIAAPYLTKELGLTAAAHGHRVLRVLVELRAAADSRRHLPGSIRHAVTYSLALTLWSAFTAFMGVVTSLPMLFLARIGVGVFEAPCFPANSRILATWFPQQERARANSIYSVGQYAGIAFLSVPLFWVTQQFGWRGLFFLAGGFGIVLGALFWSTIASRAKIRTSAQRNWRTSKPAAAANTRARGPRSAGATSASCSGTARSSARRSASSAATRRRCSS